MKHAWEDETPEPAKPSVELNDAPSVTYGLKDVSCTILVGHQVGGKTQAMLDKLTAELRQENATLKAEVERLKVYEAMCDDPGYCR